MIFGVRNRGLLALLSAMLATGVAGAAPLSVQTNPTGTAVLMKPLTLTRVRDMNFGLVGTTGAGTMTINPFTGAISVTGGVSSLGGTIQTARFAGNTPSSAVVNIKVPNNNVTLTRVGGTETLIASNFTLDGQAKRTLAQAGVFQFDVGATINVAAGQAEGLYTGTFNVTIQYP